MNKLIKPILVLLGSLTFAASPYFSPEFGGFNPDRYPVPQENAPVQPAGWAFAIWGLIYLGLIIHAIAGVFKYRKKTEWDRGRIALIISLAIGTIWLPVALKSPIMATILIWFMLVSALICLYQTYAATPPWVATWPVALYAGWLSAASFVSVGLLLAGYGVLSDTLAAIVALAGATLFATINQFKLAQWPYAAAVSWGFIGIGIANYGEHNLIAGLSVVAASVLIAISASQLLRSSKHEPDREG